MGKDTEVGVIGIISISCSEGGGGGRFHAFRVCAIKTSVLPLMFGCRAAGGDVAVCEAGAISVALAGLGGLGGAFAVLQEINKKSKV